MSRSALDAAFKLPPQKGKLLKLLLVSKMLTPNDIRHELNTAVPANVVIKRLREHMSEWEPDIKSKPRIGYWLEEPEKRRLITLAKELLNAGNDNTP